MREAEAREALLGRKKARGCSGVPARYGIAALLIMSQLLCAPLFSVTVWQFFRVQCPS